LHDTVTPYILTNTSLQKYISFILNTLLLIEIKIFYKLTMDMFILAFDYFSIPFSEQKRRSMYSTEENVDLRFL